MAALGSITIPQGCNYVARFSILNTDGYPMNLTNKSARFRVSNKELTEKYIDITGSTNNINPNIFKGSCLIDDPENGSLLLELEPHSRTELPSNNEAEEAWIVQQNNIYSLTITDNSTEAFTEGKYTNIMIRPTIVDASACHSDKMILSVDGVLYYPHSIDYTSVSSILDSLVDYIENTGDTMPFMNFNRVSSDSLSVKATEYGRDRLNIDIQSDNLSIKYDVEVIDAGHTPILEQKAGKTIKILQSDCFIEAEL